LLGKSKLRAKQLTLKSYDRNNRYNSYSALAAGDDYVLQPRRVHPHPAGDCDNRHLVAVDSGGKGLITSANGLGNNLSPGKATHETNPVERKTMNTQQNETKQNDQLGDETRALLAATADATEDTVIEARNRLKSALDATGEACARVKAKAVEGAKATDKLIRENPYQALGIAFGVGALLGFLLSRRNRD
jgi:ElaB/YqjD/DUF883 family membrane-anchored ribosome-binding protein